MRRALALFAVLLLSLLPAATLARQATPAADGFVTPDPAACQVAPRDVAELQAWVATPAAAAPAAAGTPALPVGEPADAATVAAITATAEELYACYNANAFLQVYALYTDRYLAASLAQEDINPEALTLFATPIAPQDADARFAIQVRDVETLPDGRVGAWIDSRNPLGGNVESAAYYVFVEEDGAWRVDDILVSGA